MNKISKLFFAFGLIVFTFLISCKKDNYNANSFTDPRDGTVYKTITIGNQVWMAENLKYLPRVVDPTTSSLTTPCYYVYGYDGTSVTNAKATVNYSVYGVLYNWEAAKVACPEGWHLPSESEWTQLIDYLGGESIAGDKLKEIGTTHWSGYNTGATNEIGFTALPGGLCGSTFSFAGTGGYWWSATKYGTFFAYERGIFSNTSYIRSTTTSKELGLAVRCVRD